MNPKSIGERSEGFMLAKLLSLGFAVSIPFGNNQRYDMLIDDNGKIVRAQCKTGRIRTGAVKFKTCSTNGFTGENRDYRSSVDVFLIYCVDNGLCYRVPVESCGKREMHLRLTPCKNGQARGVHWAKDYQMALSSVDRAGDS